MHFLQVHWNDARLLAPTSILSQLLRLSIHGSINAQSAFSICLSKRVAKTEEFGYIERQE
jgi:hypothetical protein